VSIGSASVLRLYNSTRFKVPPTTCYIMTFNSNQCIANCGFCPQGRESKSSDDLLSRVNWPVFQFKDFIAKFSYLNPSKRFKRLCLQTLNYPNNVQDAIEIISKVREKSDIPISIAIPPIPKKNLQEIKNLGVERIGIALDASTPEIFDKIKGKGVNGPYTWDSHFKALEEALDIFSEGFVTTHLIVGLGESSKDIFNIIYDLKNLKIKVGLFAFTPIKGTKLESLNPPDLLYFRKIQLGRYLILEENKDLNDFIFNNKGEIVKFNINMRDFERVITQTDAFLTSGCPGCNRPYYTSRPTGPIYNYPKKLNEKEKKEIYNSLLEFVN
jgi:biotin synthase-related radical SAM superfamily protein